MWRKYFSKQYLVPAFSLLLLVLMACATLGAFAIQKWLYQPLSLQKDHIITIKKGDTLSKVAYQLEESGVLASAKLFVMYARLTEQTHINIGEYLLPQLSTRSSLLALLQSDDVISYKLTLVEGKTFTDFLQTLKKHEKITSVLNSEGDYNEDAYSKDNYVAILKQLNIDVEHPEGWFFPDTYQFVSGTTDADILKQSYGRMVQVLNEEWAQRSSDLPYQNAYEALIMASIIEKETGVAYERPEIAGVFVRRLKKGMRLQTDPTIIYGLGKEYQGNIRRKHLRQKTPYNTYVIDGLPPTPIAMPGREAIHAALHPKAGKSLFFVAKGDGSHYFSETLAEHNKAVRQYQINQRRQNYQSAPSQ